MDFSAILGNTGSIFRSFLNSPFFLTLKFLLAIYVAVLFADFVMLVMLRELGDVRSSVRGMNMPLISSKKMKKRWKKIEMRLLSGNPSQYKLAIIEADAIIDKIFSDMKFKGENLVERLENLKPEQVADSEEIKNAHKLRNQIIHDEKLEISREKAKETLNIYKKFLRDNEFMEE